MLTSVKTIPMVKVCVLYVLNELGRKLNFTKEKFQFSQGSAGEMKAIVAILLIFDHVAHGAGFSLWDPLGVFGDDKEEDFVENKQDLSTGSFNSSYLIVGTLLLGGLIIASAGLYALDVYATARIDQFLLDYYGPQIYDRYTTDYEPSSSTTHFTATTANKYYGYRSLYGLKVLSWLETAYLAYGAAKEAFGDPVCQKRLICELKSTPSEDQSFWSLKLAPILQMIYQSEENDIYQLGHKEICGQHYQGCSDFSQFLQRSSRE